MKLFFNLVSAVVCVLSLSLIPLSTARVASAAPVSAPLAQATTVTFAAFGDYGSDSANEQAVATLVAGWNPDFIITTGDNSYGSAAPVAPAVSTIDQNIGKYYSQYIGSYNGGYSPAGTTDKFFPSMGNHDYTDGGGSTAYFNYFTLPSNERYYDFVQGPVHFFVIDSNPSGTGSAPGDGRSSDFRAGNLAGSRVAGLDCAVEDRVHAPSAVLVGERARLRDSPCSGPTRSGVRRRCWRGMTTPTSALCATTTATGSACPTL